jgi:hypothetical protein
MADGELLDAREAMSMLGINEGELQTLVARGDLRAFRSAGTMKFRRDDVVTLKSEKGTEPTIIIPAASGVRKSASGILPAIPAAGTARPPSRVGPAAPAMHESATSDIVLDDIELMPTDDASVTNQVTAAQTALGGATVMETAQHGNATGSMTVLDGNIAEQGTGHATAITGSGRRVAVQQPSPTGAAPAINAPAMSRVRAAVAPGVSMATSKRTLAVYQAKSASPVWTAIAILNSVVFMLAASICGVMMAKGSFDQASKERVIPPFLNQDSQFAIYRWCYESTPGSPADKKPPSEYAGQGGAK